MNLNQITIPSLDLTKSIPFYEQLGLKLIVKSLPHYARFECPNGNSTFSIHQTETLPKGNGIHVYFSVKIWMKMLISSRKTGLNLNKNQMTKVGYGEKQD